MARNPAYWGTPAKLASATIKIIPDPAAAVAALLAGDVDAFANSPAPEAMPQLASDPRLKVVIGTTEGETHLAINYARKPLDDLRLHLARASAREEEASAGKEWGGRVRDWGAAAQEKK